MKARVLKHSRWLRWTVAAVLVLLALVLVAWVAVPPLVQGQIQKIASARLGRQVTVGKVDFNPFRLDMALHDLRIASADGSRPQLSIARVHVDAALQSVVRLAPVIDALAIEQPAAELTRRADGGYDVDDILARLAAEPAKPQGEPAKFAVHNIVVSGGAFDFTDQSIGRTQQLRDLTLQVPFLSNLPSQRDITTEPKLAFVLNGSRFDSTALTTPFADNRKTDARLNFKGLDLAPYLGYLPRGLPVQLQAGTLDADLKIDFERGANAGLKLSGSIEAHGTRLADHLGAHLADFESLRLELAEARPLEQAVHLSAVSLVAPQLALARDAAGRLNLLATQPADGATKKIAASPQPTSAAAEKGPEKPVWRVQVDQFTLARGNIAWRDETTRPAATAVASQLQLEAHDVTWPMARPARFDGATTVQGAQLKFSGQATDKLADAQAEVSALPLSLAAPYLAQSLEPTLDGKLSGTLDVAWQPAGLRLKARRLAVDGLALSQGKAALASVGRFEVADAEADMTRHTLAIGSVTATQPKVRVERDADRRWMFERWLKAPAGSAQAGTPAARTAVPRPAGAGDAGPGANSTPWTLTIARLAVGGGAVSYADRASETPVVFDITALDVQAGKIAPGSATASPLQVSGRIATTGRRDPGRFDYRGTLVLKPLATEGQLDVAGLPAHAFKAYYADALNNVDVRRAYLGYRGTLRYAAAPGGLNLRLAGDTSLEDFRARSATLTQARGIDSSNELLSWKALGLRGLQVTLKPGAAPLVEVKETSLTDFFARVIIDETGRLNLQDLAKPRGQKTPAAAVEPPRTAAELAATPTPNASAAIKVEPALPSAPPLSVAAGPAPVRITTQRNRGGGTTTTRAPAASAGRAATARGPSVPAELMVGGDAAPARPSAAVAATNAPADAASGGPKPVMRFGPMSLVNGRIDFTDNFIKPNYSADLTQLTGQLSGFSSAPPTGPPVLADLELRGRAQQTATLEITGKVNPLVKPLELDITAKMRDLDLPPLSPYSVRYAGHGIERGKLSMEVHYVVQPDGQLTATNKLVLNQLRFGDEVKGAPASLPVRLAVALLADRDGVINVDLPLAGSINDPQFSIGPLIFKAFANLIAKAVTAPFRLLTGGFGGGGAGESSAIAFDAGSATLSSVARQNLDKVAKALADRPKLELTVVGTASLERERDAYQRQRLRQLAQAEKRRVAARAGRSTADIAPVTDAEYPELLAAVYKRADIAAKPRNVIGLAKDLPTAEMENLLLASIPVDEGSMRELAEERASAVRDYLLGQKLDASRLFLGAVRTHPDEAGWKPGAELNLATN